MSERDDDYTPEAINRTMDEPELDGDDAYPDFGEDEDAKAAAGQPSKVTGEPERLRDILPEVKADLEARRGAAARGAFPADARLRVARELLRQEASGSTGMDPDALWAVLPPGDRQVYLRRARLLIAAAQDELP